MNKRPIKEARKEIRLLRILLDLEIIGRVARGDLSKSPKQTDLEQKIKQLEHDYPRLNQ